VYVCNVANMRGETLGLDAADHVEALLDHGLEGCIDRVLVHRCDTKTGTCDESVDPVLADADVVARIGQMGAEVVVRDLADTADPVRHSKTALLEAFEEVLG
jgi:2-phospho-L-lactate transferase/gluconeogenesis factor (CofD/UPF0052 family)